MGLIGYIMGLEWTYSSGDDDHQLRAHFFLVFRNIFREKNIYALVTPINLVTSTSDWNLEEPITNPMYQMSYIKLHIKCPNLIGSVDIWVQAFPMKRPTNWMTSDPRGLHALLHFPDALRSFWLRSPAHFSGMKEATKKMFGDTRMFLFSKGLPSGKLTWQWNMAIEIVDWY